MTSFSTMHRVFLLLSFVFITEVDNLVLGFSVSAPPSPRRGPSFSATSTRSSPTCSSPATTSGTRLAALFLLDEDEDVVTTSLLTDLAHFSLDIYTLNQQASKMTLRLLSLLGRLCLLSADYLPDHNIRYDEFFFQGIMMMTTLWAILHTSRQDERSS